MNAVKSYFDKVSPEYKKASQRLLWKKVRNREAAAVTDLLPEIGPQTSALDLGCGSGYYADLLHKHQILNLTCVDFSEKMLIQINNPSYIKINANIEKFQSKIKYDVIVCGGALEFTQAPEKVFTNVSKMLNPGGIFILLCPAKGALGRIYRLFHSVHAVPVQLYEREQLSALAAKVGLRMQTALSVLPFSIVAKFTNA